MNSFVPIAALIVLATGGCGNDEPMTRIDRWFSTTRTLTEQQQPDSDLMQIDPNADCELVSEIEIKIGGQTARTLWSDNGTVRTSREPVSMRMVR